MVVRCVVDARVRRGLPDMSTTPHDPPVGRAISSANSLWPEGHDLGPTCMDYANDNMPAGSVRIRVRIPALSVALVASCAVWFVLGLTLWRALSGWLHAL